MVHGSTGTLSVRPVWNWCIIGMRCSEGVRVHMCCPSSRPAPQCAKFQHRSPKGEAEASPELKLGDQARLQTLKSERQKYRGIGPGPWWYVPAPVYNDGPKSTETESMGTCAPLQEDYIPKVSLWLSGFFYISYLHKALVGNLAA